MQRKCPKGQGGKKQKFKQNQKGAWNDGKAKDLYRNRLEIILRFCGM